SFHMVRRVLSAAHPLDRESRDERHGVSALKGSGQPEGHVKDAILMALAEHGNVAQFVSFGPGTPELRFVCLSDPPPTAPSSLEPALALLFERSLEGLINVRAFDPTQPKSHEFLYGLSTVEEAATHVRRLAASGLYTIANETVDVHDGG